MIEYDHTIWRERKITIVMVTHNIEEALELGDRIGVMSSRPGKLDTIITNTLPHTPESSIVLIFLQCIDKLVALVKI